MIVLGVTFIGFILAQPEIGGAWLAKAFGIYCIAFLAIPTALFLNLLVQ